MNTNPIVSSEDAEINHIGIVSTWSVDALGGLSAYIRQLERGLRAEGVTVTKAARFVSSEIPGGFDYHLVEDVHDVSPPSTTTGVLRPNPVYLPILRELGHFVNRPLLRELAERLFTSAFASDLKKAFPTKVDHLHYVGTGQELLGFSVLAEARRRNIGLSIWPAVHPSQWGDGPNDIRLYRHADTVFCQSKYESDWLAGLGVPREKLQITGLGPATDAEGDAARFRARHGLGNRPLVLFVGRKDRGKGYHALCEAFPALLRQVPSACLVAVGPAKEPPFPTVPESALLDLGTAEEAEKADALAACNVFCMPSISEAFGIAYVEAWSYKKPVVGGMAPAVRELITDDVNGYCVPQEPETIARVLALLLKDADLCASLGKAGYELQCQRYNWSAVTKLHRQVFAAAARTHNRLSSHANT